MSKRRQHRINESSKKLEAIRAAQLGLDEGVNISSHPEAWRQGHGRGGSVEGPRVKVSLPRIGFLERPDLSKRR